ncbi:hypothetical protein VTO42DRAFT_2847 [Malbranchea cinnamomea]
MAVPLRPQHFASRQDGTLTALIAVDELPSFISIRGVPRVLSQSDTQGMTSLGILPARGQTYTVDVIHHGNSSLEIAGAVVRSQTAKKEISSWLFAAHSDWSRVDAAPGQSFVEEWRAHRKRASQAWRRPQRTQSKQQEGILFVLAPSWRMRLPAARQVPLSCVRLSPEKES